jgi:hypothetical protein
MRTAQPVDAWTAYFAILTEALSASPLPREFRGESGQGSPLKAAASPLSSPTAARQLLHRGLIDRLDHWFWTQRQRSFERQLAQCNDIYEVEAQMRSFERPSGNLFS